MRGSSQTVMATVGAVTLPGSGASCLGRRAAVHNVRAERAYSASRSGHGCVQSGSVQASLGEGSNSTRKGGIYCEYGEQRCSTRTSASSSMQVLLAIGASAFVSAASLSGVEAALAQEGGALFNRSCAGCHSGGGNVIQPGATLLAKDLQRNGIETVEDIYSITYSGKGRMPGFGELCTPRGQCTFGPRLSEVDIRTIAEYVKSQAEQGWSRR